MSDHAVQRVLVIDGEPARAGVYVAAFADPGLAVEIATNEDTIVASLTARHPDLAVVHQLGELSPFKAADLVRQYHLDLPLLVLVTDDDRHSAGYEIYRGREQRRLTFLDLRGSWDLTSAAAVTYIGQRIQQAIAESLGAGAPPAAPEEPETTLVNLAPGPDPDRPQAPPQLVSPAVDTPSEYDDQPSLDAPAPEVPATAGPEDPAARGPEADAQPPVPLSPAAELVEPGPSAWQGAAAAAGPEPTQADPPAALSPSAPAAERHVAPPAEDPTAILRAELNTTRAQALHDREEAVLQISGLTTELAQRSAELERIQAELGASRAELSAARAATAQLEADKDQVIRELEAHTRELGDQVDALKQQVSELQVELHDLRTARAVADEARDAALRQAQEADARLSQTARDGDDKVALAMARARTEHEQELSARSAELERLTAQRDRLVSKLDFLRTNLAYDEDLPGREEGRDPLGVLGALERQVGSYAARVQHLALYGKVLLIGGGGLAALMLLWFVVWVLTPGTAAVLVPVEPGSAHVASAAGDQARRDVPAPDVSAPRAAPVAEVAASPGPRPSGLAPAPPAASPPPAPTAAGLAATQPARPQPAPDAPVVMSEAERKDVWRQLMKAYKEKRYGDAIAAAERLRRAGELDWEAQLTLARALRDNGQTSKAMDAYYAFTQRFKDNSFTDDAQYELAELYRAKGDTRNALGYYQYVADNPRSNLRAKAREQIARLQKGKGR